MKKILISFIRQFLFWILFFNLNRLVFILYYIRIIQAENISFSEVPGIFLHSFHLDLATACYLMILPFFLLLIQSIYSPKWLNWINKIYTSILIFIYSLTEVGEMGIYSDWKTKLTYKILKYFSHPSEIYNSAETTTFFLLFLLLIFLTLTGIFAYYKLFYVEINHEKRRWWFTLAFLLLTPGLLFMGLRGGTQQIPITPSESYYSKHNILNLAAVNNLFNLYISVFENLPNFSKNPYIFMDDKVAETLVSQIYYTPRDTTISILKTSRPNIMLIILESWSADLVEDLGGEPGISPEFKKLEKGGILFDSIFASGSRSEQGMACIFGGFPAHPISSITIQPDKFIKLPSMPRIMNKLGYQTSYYFGGQLIYGNIKSYIFFNEFKRIVEGDDFPKELPRGKLGIHDEYTLEYWHQEMNREKEPFFSALFTVSTHSPWDEPYPRQLSWGGNEHKYINSAHYTDHCLGDFFARVKNEPWYKNTLFIIVADHSRNSYRNWHPHSRDYHKIPLLFYGDVIKDEWKGKVWHMLGNQHDLAATLLAQLGQNSKDFHWSKNLMNPFSPQFAYYTTEDGLGWQRRNAYFAWDSGPNYFYFDMIPPKIHDSIVKEGKAYLQRVFGEYYGD